MALIFILSVFHYAECSESILARYPEFRGSPRVVREENLIADQDHLERIKNMERLGVLVKTGVLVPVPEEGDGFFLDTDTREGIPAWRRYLRPEAFFFLREASHAYHARFRKFLKIDSLVRPENVQEKEAFRNPNALRHNSLHLTGCAFDISLKSMPYAEQEWLVAYFASHMRLSHGKIRPTYEHLSSLNFHIVVFP